MAVRAVQEVLATWRDAERLLEVLPPSSSDRKVVQLAIVRLRSTYRRLTSSSPASREPTLQSVQDTLDETAGVLAATRERLRRDPEASAVTPLATLEIEATG